MKYYNGLFFKEVCVPLAFNTTLQLYSHFKSDIKNVPGNVVTRISEQKFNSKHNITMYNVPSSYVVSFIPEVYCKTFS